MSVAGRPGPAGSGCRTADLESHQQASLVEATSWRTGAADLDVTGARATLPDEPAPDDGLLRAPRRLFDERATLASRSRREEIFGPVQVLIPFDDEADAVAIAERHSTYGLVAAVVDARRGAPVPIGRTRWRAGQVFINNYGAGGGVELPFGGVGKSGHGREKGFEALYGFSVLKTVAVTARLRQL